jgi:Flp pilus assembly protein TadG
MRCAGRPHPSGRRVRRSQQEQGAALVEFALVLPLICALLLGLTSGGMAYNRKISLTNGLREGARFGATLDGPTATGWATDVQNRTAELTQGDLTTAQVCVKLVKKGTGDVYTLLPSGSTCAATAEPGMPFTAATGDCVVKVWAARPDKLQAMFFTSAITLRASAVARYEAKVTGSTPCN